MWNHFVKWWKKNARPCLNSGDRNQVLPDPVASTHGASMYIVLWVLSGIQIFTHYFVLEEWCRQKVLWRWIKQQFCCPLGPRRHHNATVAATKMRSKFMKIYWSSMVIRQSVLQDCHWEKIYLGLIMPPCTMKLNVSEFYEPKVCFCGGNKTNNEIVWFDVLIVLFYSQESFCLLQQCIMQGKSILAFPAWFMMFSPTQILLKLFCQRWKLFFVCLFIFQQLKTK